jgi:hypothetical protein
MTMRQLAEATDYNGLIAAIRNRADELQVAGETIDEVAGLPARYSAKLLGPNQVRRIGAVSLGPLLGALALKLIIVEDEDALRQYGVIRISCAASATQLCIGPGQHTNIEKWA